MLQVAHDRNAEIAFDYYLLDKHPVPSRRILNLVTSPSTHSYSSVSTIIIFYLNYSSSLPSWTFTLLHICHNHVFLISSNSFYL